jgi:CBS domain containing-hemolysin-like protein
MSDPDSSDNGRGLRGLFRREKSAEANEAAGSPGEDTGMDPHEMRLRIAEFEQMTVVNVMVPRAEVKAVEVETGLDELVKYFAEVSNSRLPVYRDSLDDPLGFVHIKDLVAELANEAQHPKRPLERLRRDVLFVPPSMKLSNLLVKMQSTRIHLALVVDEYGGTDGLVTLEDLVEEIVGDIEDEHDQGVPMFVRRSQRVWEADARTEIGDFASETGLDLSLADMETEIDTLGGVAFALGGKVPVRGEILRHPTGPEIEIMDADARRIRRVRVRVPENAVLKTDQE